MNLDSILCIEVKKKHLRFKLKVFMTILLYSIISQSIIAQVSIVSTSPPTAAGICNGEIIMEETGGSLGPYSYEWIHPIIDCNSLFDLYPNGNIPAEVQYFCNQQNNLSLNNLCDEGTYILNITDNYGCTDQLFVNLGNCNEIGLDISGVSNVCPKEIYGYKLFDPNDVAAELSGNIMWEVFGNTDFVSQVGSELIVQWSDGGFSSTIKAEYSLNGCIYNFEKVVSVKTKLDCSVENGGGTKGDNTDDKSYTSFSENCSGPLQHFVSNHTLSTTVKTVPVVFHMVYDDNINYINDFDAKVTEIIEKVNLIYANQTPGRNTYIQFALAQVSPEGDCNKNGANEIENIFASRQFTDEQLMLQQFDNLAVSNFWKGCINVFYTPGSKSFGNPSLGRVFLNAESDDFESEKVVARLLGESLGLRITRAGGCESNDRGINCLISGDYICDTAPYDACEATSGGCHTPSTPGGVTCQSYQYCGGTSEEVNNAIQSIMNDGVVGCQSYFTPGQIIRLNALLENKICEHIDNAQVQQAWGFGPYYYDFSYLTSIQNLYERGVIGKTAQEPIEEEVMLRDYTEVKSDCDRYFGESGGTLAVGDEACINIKSGTLYSVESVMEKVVKSKSNYKEANDELIVGGDFEHTLFPNPFKVQSTLQFNLPQEGNVNIKLYDLSGHLINNLVNNKHMSKGKHEISILGKDLTPGYYLYNISIENYEGTGKLIVIE